MKRTRLRNIMTGLTGLILVLALLMIPGRASLLGAGREMETAVDQRIAIIIDDFGNNMAGSDEMLQLEVPITVAVMPFLPTTAEDAAKAHRQGYDVLVHLPMEPKQGKPEWLGPGAIMASMSDAEVRAKVEEAIDNVPHAVGINNHMGSKITGDERVMGIILDVCRDRGLFYVDSKTNYRSVVPKLCREKGLPLLENAIFLDDVYNTGHVTVQLQKAQKQAREQGTCITIGHVGIQGKITSAALKAAIPGLKAEGVRFIKISELAQEQSSPGITPVPGFTLP